MAPSPKKKEPLCKCTPKDYFILAALLTPIVACFFVGGFFFPERGLAEVNCGPGHSPVIECSAHQNETLALAPQKEFDSQVRVFPGLRGCCLVAVLPSLAGAICRREGER